MYQSSHPGMTETGEKTALPQSTTNDRVSKKICYVYMNLFTNDVQLKKKMSLPSLEFQLQLSLSLLS